MRRGRVWSPGLAEPVAQLVTFAAEVPDLFAFQCAGCGFYRPDPSFLPAIAEHIVELRADRELAVATDAAAWVLADRAVFAAGLDVAGFGAVAERGRHRGHFLDRFVGEGGRMAVAIDRGRREQPDGFLLAFEADLVVAGGGFQAAVVHQLPQHIDVGTAVGVALGVGVP